MKSYDLLRFDLFPLAAIIGCLITMTRRAWRDWKNRSNAPWFKVI